MRLERLGLVRYGHFTDAQITFPRPSGDAPDLHVIFGPNEAGKSTLFSGWLDLLFGIPARTGYNFLHDNRAMRLEAEITSAHGPLALTRVKGNTNTLLDLRSDAPLPEAALAAALGGLDRDAYTTMFSLDDDTLESGGNSILDSQGDLGQLLFSASAGLADLSTALAGLQEETAAWFAPSKRKHELAALKAHMAELMTQRKATDLAVSDWRRLVQAVAQAEDSYTQARDRQAETRAAVAVLRRDLDVLPKLAHLRKLESRLADKPAPREIPADWRAALPGWLAEAAELRALLPAAEDRIRELESALQDIPQDAAAAPHVARLDDLEGRFGAISKERADLPRRRAELDELTRQQDALLARLNRPGLTLDAALLPPDTRARLAELVAAQGVLATRLDTAQQELARAQTALRDAPDSAPADDAALARLAPLMADLRRADLLRLQAEAQERHQTARASRDLAFIALAPWHGDAQTLAALDLPAEDTLRALEQTLTEAHDATRTAKQDHARLEDSIARLRAGVESADPVSAQDTAASRATRDAAWKAHKAQLSAHTAAEFEAAMREDDALQAARLEQARRAEKLAHLRQEEASLAQAAKRLEAAHTAQAQTKAQLAQHWAALGLAPEGRSLPDLRAWMARRATALAAEDALQAASAHADALAARLQKARDTLATALAACGRPLPETDFALLMAEGEAVLAAAETLRQQAQARRDLAAREDALAKAEAARATWQAELDALCAGCWIATPSPDVATIRSILNRMDELAALVPQADTLRRRIARIEEDIAEFAATLNALAATLDEAPDPDPAALWPRLRARLREAERQDSDRDRLTEDLRKARAQHLALTQRRTRLEADTAPLHAAFPDASLPEISEQITAIREAQQLDEDCASLRADLAVHLKAEDLGAEIARLDALDPAEMLAKAESLETILSAQETAVAEAYAALVQAEQARDGAGADGTAARLEAERKTIALQIADQARHFMARQAGMLAVEQALRLYRDTHRSEMMARASAAFSLLTGGRYQGLSTQPEGRSETLIAQQQGGGSKAVNTLSKGTRFQLYLALRAAGYLELARSRPSVPFVADDIMETFDDTRAEAAFRLLAQMAQQGQVIYLTHHAHLCDIAQRACPQVHLHDLGGL